jgi:hypothetical protein
MAVTGFEPLLWCEPVPSIDMTWMRCLLRNDRKLNSSRARTSNYAGFRVTKPRVNNSRCCVFLGEVYVLRINGLLSSDLGVHSSRPEEGVLPIFLWAGRGESPGSFFLFSDVCPCSYTREYLALSELENFSLFTGSAFSICFCRWEYLLAYIFSVSNIRCVTLQIPLLYMG